MSQKGKQVVEKLVGEEESEGTGVEQVLQDVDGGELVERIDVRDDETVEVAIGRVIGEMLGRELGGRVGRQIGERTGRRTQGVLGDEDDGSVRKLLESAMSAGGDANGEESAGGAEAENGPEAESDDGGEGAERSEGDGSEASGELTRKELIVQRIQDAFEVSKEEAEGILDFQDEEDAGAEGGAESSEVDGEQPEESSGDETSDEAEQTEGGEAEREGEEAEREGDEGSETEEDGEGAVEDGQETDESEQEGGKTEREGDEESGEGSEESGADEPAVDTKTVQGSTEEVVESLRQMSDDDLQAVANDLVEELKQRQAS